MRSGKLKINKLDYVLEGDFYIQNKNFASVEKLIYQKQSRGVIYGEMGIFDNFDVSLTKISHYIEDIHLEH